MLTYNNGCISCRPCGFLGLLLDVWVHVLLCAAVNILDEVLHNGSAPESLFNAPTPFSPDPEYTVKVLCSVTGRTALWKPQYMKFPELSLRADVVVRGPKVEDAIFFFLDMIAKDCEELNDVPVYFVSGLYVEDDPSVKYEGDCLWGLREVGQGMQVVSRNA